MALEENDESLVDEINDTFNVSMTNSTLKSVENLKLNNVLDINENTIKAHFKLTTNELMQKVQNAHK